LSVDLAADAFNYPKEENPAPMTRVLVTLAAALTLVGCSTASERADKAEPETAVARVIDGDTIETENGDHVRLVQIDAPELGDNECYAREATTALRDLLAPGTAVRLEADERLDDVDRFGRLLRYVHLGEQNVNLELVKRGAAAVWFFEGDRGRYADELLEATQEARDETGASGAPARPRGSIQTTRSTPIDAPGHPLE
jgi:endonuclease YncB( thermonuclease family)